MSKPVSEPLNPLVLQSSSQPTTEIQALSQANKCAYN